MTIIDLAALKAALSDVPGIASLTETIIGGRRVYGFNGLIAAVDVNADQAAVESAIRKAAAMRPAAPAADPSTSQPATGNRMSVTGAKSASLSLKQLMADAKQSVADGMNEVQEAIAQHAQAGAALKSLGSDIKSEASDLMSTIGQFKNDLLGESDGVKTAAGSGS